MAVNLTPIRTTRAGGCDDRANTTRIHNTRRRHRDGDCRSISGYRGEPLHRQTQRGSQEIHRNHSGTNSTGGGVGEKGGSPGTKASAKEAELIDRIIIWIQFHIPIFRSDVYPDYQMYLDRTKEAAERQTRETENWLSEQLKGRPVAGRNAR